MSATPRLARLRSLSPLERRVLGEALLLLPIACTALRFAGLRRTQVLLERSLRDGMPREGLDARAVARLVSIAARHGPVRARCLAASLALNSLLRRYGMRGDLKLGVRKRDGRFEAHAWIEHDGAALLEPPGIDGRYAVFEEAIALRR